MQNIMAARKKPQNIAAIFPESLNPKTRMTIAINNEQNRKATMKRISPASVANADHNVIKK
ncbi:MAG: hypothetical protein RL708_80 [Bacteroidota bacterium]